MTVLVEGEDRQLPTDQKGLSRGILDVFCSCPMVRLVRLGNPLDDKGSQRRAKTHAEISARGPKRQSSSALGKKRKRPRLIES
jgi:hypothetical protein